MNPQPVSLADELRRLVERLRTIGDALRTTNLIRGREIHQLADDFARFAAHAAEQPKLTAEQVQVVVQWLHYRMCVAQNLPYENGDTCEDCEESVREILQQLALLTSPVAPPPHPLVPLDGGNWYYDAQRDIVMIDGRKYEPAVEKFRIPSVMAAIAPPVAPGEQPPNEFPCPEDERKATTAGESGIIPAGNLPAEAQERASAKSTLVDIMVGNTWEQSVAAFERALTTAAKQAREECAGKLEKVAAQCEAGGHTSRGKMFRAIAAEFRT